MASTWREVQRFTVAAEAEALHARLLAAGVGAVMPDMRVMGRHPSCRATACEVRVLVPAEDYERARVVMSLTSPAAAGQARTHP